MIIIYAIVGCVIIAFIIFRIVLVRRGGHSFPWLQFYINGKEEGFRMKQIGNLQRLVMRAELRDPLAVYWSQKALSHCIVVLDRQYKAEGTLEQPREARFMRRMYDLLNRITHSSQRKKRGIRTTREMDAHIPIQIIYHGRVYQSNVIEIQLGYIAIAHPRALNPNANIDFDKKDTVFIRFWRRNDSGYEFKTKLMPADSAEDAAVLHIQHARKVVRTKMRTHTRKQIDKPGTLFLMASHRENIRALKQSAGLRCQIVDISEGGMSILIGGKVFDQTGFKIKTTVRGIDIAMTTKLISKEYNENKNISLLRLRAMNQDLIMRNRISALVYDINTNVSDLEFAPLEPTHEQTNALEKTTPLPAARQHR